MSPTRARGRCRWSSPLSWPASWVLLLFAFRSLVLAFKAIVMNLLASGAAFGLAVLVLQGGRGGWLLDVDRAGFIQVVLPLFALVFGLSMDYEVFLLSRVREEWRRTGDNARAVRFGITRTAHVITAAAAIMVVVFASFLFTRVLEIKQMGFMLAVAVLIDATIVRLLLVPAFMRLMAGGTVATPMDRPPPTPHRHRLTMWPRLVRSPSWLIRAPADHLFDVVASTRRDVCGVSRQQGTRTWSFCPAAWSAEGVGDLLAETLVCDGRWMPASISAWTRWMNGPTLAPWNRISPLQGVRDHAPQLAETPCRRLDGLGHDTACPSRVTTERKAPAAGVSRGRLLIMR
jgi:MMPL family